MPKEEFNIIKMWEYHHRLIFLTKISEKYQLFYKSSGLAGHNSKGEIFPIHFLKTNQSCIGDEFDEMPYGWLPKVFKVNGVWRSYYSKDPKIFPLEMQRYFDLLKNLDLVEYEKENDPLKINDFISKYIKFDDDFVDWK